MRRLHMYYGLPGDPFVVTGSEKEYQCEENELDIGMILKVAGVGILVSAAAQILQKSGRDEQSTLVVIAGIVVVLIMLVGEIETLFQVVMSAFGF